MIIVSQDKEEIVNFNKVDSIWICSDEEGSFTIEATADTNATLAYYKTKERAKEVLQEMISIYSNHELSKQMNNPRWIVENLKCRAFVYEMPEK